MSKRVLARAFIASTMLFGVLHAGMGEAQARRQPVKAASAKTLMPDRECLARAMYFESDRNREDGMLAVGTIVANRLQSGRYGSSLCGVVGQFLQFAPGVLTRRMAEQKPAERAFRIADAVLAGARHPTAGDAMYFHTANVPFRHDDKAYVLVSGGNAFYRWNRRVDEDEARENTETLARARDAAPKDRDVGERAIDKAMVAQSDMPVVAPEPVALTEAVSTVRPEVALASLVTTDAPTAAPSPVQTVKAVEAGVVEPKVAHEIVAAPSALSNALAFRGEPARTPAASEALSVVMSLGPRERTAETKIRRVVAPAAPVYASSAPIFHAKSEPKTNPMANFVVAQAWSGFD